MPFKSTSQGHLPEKQLKGLTSTDSKPTSIDTSTELIAGPIPIRCWLIIICELCERFTFYGITLQFVTYLTTNLHQTETLATTINRTFQFLAYLFTIIGAIISDLYLGKFKSIVLFSLLYLVGLILMTVSDLDAVRGTGENNLGLILFSIALFGLFGLGMGGIKATVSVFCADQIDKTSFTVDNITSDICNSSELSHTNSYDYNLTVERVFRYFYWSINVGSLLGPLVCPLLINLGYSFATSFLVASLVFLVGLLIFVVGNYKFKYIETDTDNDNGFLNTYRIFKTAIVNRNISTEQTSEDGSTNHWLDKAKINNKFEVSSVDQLKVTLKACSIFVYFVIYWTINNNTSDAFIIMGLTMTRPTWLQPEQLNIVNSIIIILGIPILESCILPFLRKRGYKLGPILRIKIGFVLNVLASLYVTLLQLAIYTAPPYYNFTTVAASQSNTELVNQVSIWYQLPAYFLLAVSEIFAATTVLELAFQSSAENLKSIVTSVYYLSICGSYLLGMFFSIWSYNPNYLIIYGVQTGLMFVTTLIFAWHFKGMD